MRWNDVLRRRFEPIDQQGEQCPSPKHIQHGIIGERALKHRKALLVWSTNEAQTPVGWIVSARFKLQLGGYRACIPHRGPARAVIETQQL